MGIGGGVGGASDDWPKSTCLIGKRNVSLKLSINDSLREDSRKKNAFRNRWYLRASSLLSYNTKATNAMPTIKLVFPVKWQTLQSHGSQ